MQKQAQLAATLRDLKEFLPGLLDTRQTYLNLILDAFSVADGEEKEAIKQELVGWIRKHPKDAASALSTLNAIAGTIVKPEQLPSTSKTRIRLVAGKKGQFGVEITQ